MIKSKQQFYSQKRKKLKRNKIQSSGYKTKVIRRATYIALPIIVLSIVVYSVYPNLYNWYINKTYEWHVVETKAYKAWDVNQGDDVTIAVIDTGIHSELVEHLGDRVMAPYNVIKQTDSVKDSSGHGTEVICLIACDDFKGIKGIAPKANIMPIVAVDESGRTSPDYIADSIIYAVDNGAEVINLSLGSRLENYTVKLAVEYANENNVHIVSAAGDYKEDKLLYPARHELVIGVEAQSKLNGRRYLESNWGDGSVIMLPGEVMKTVTINDKDELEIAYKNGTSYSTPIGSGLVALYINKNNDVDNNILITKLKQQATENDYFDIYDFLS